MVETGHLPSSNQTFSTVPAFPSVSTTALPINSDCAAPYSFKIFDARRFAAGIARPCSAEPSELSKAAQRRRLSQGSAAGMIDGDCSSNSRSRSICVLKLPGSSGSSFRTRVVSPRSLEQLLGCVWNLCQCGCASGRKAPASAPAPPAALPLASTAGNSEWNWRPPLLAICASACF
jgi:hypothetical protein